nr:hypothetical protein [Tanacetum cinerariifolium]
MRDQVDSLTTHEASRCGVGNGVPILYGIFFIAPAIAFSSKVVQCPNDGCGQCIKVSGCGSSLANDSSYREMKLNRGCFGLLIETAIRLYLSGKSSLETMCIRTISLKVEVEKIIRRGIGFVDVEITFTPRAKRHNNIGSEHLMLGSLREYEGVGARVLENIGADQATFVRSSLLKLSIVEEKFQEYLKPTTSLSSHFPGRRMWIIYFKVFESMYNMWGMPKPNTG